MKTLIAFLLLASTAIAQDFDWAIEAPSFDWSIADSAQDESAQATDGLSQLVHRINVANRAGSCVCIAPGAYVTAKHVFEGLSNYQVSIDGQAVAASVTLAPSHDVAIVKCLSEAAAASVETGDAEYLSRVTAYGTFSEVAHEGFISNDDTLAITSDAEIKQGDSGGGVFCDGKLVGVIRGKNPNNGRVCYFTPISSVAALVASFSPAEGRLSDKPQPGADKPSITITVADFYCAPCDELKAMDWSAFTVDWKVGGDVKAFPEISWIDQRGVKRVLTGAYSPKRVMWSWEKTQ
jgi:hypothetical protein